MRWNRVAVIAHKEWMESVNSPVPYVAMGLYFLVIGWFFSATLFLSGQATMDEVFGSLPLLLAIFLPAFTMRLFSEEYKSGTIETLATLPLEDAEIVAGKFLSALITWMCLLGLSLFYPLLLLLAGSPDLGQIAVGFLGALLLGGFYAALGLFASSVTRSQVVGFLLGFLFCFAVFIVGKTAQFVPGIPGQLLTFLGADAHLESFSRGVVDTRDVLYFLSGQTLALAGTLASFQSRRWR